jgi:WXG100 family type VII secretion target
MTDGHLLVTFGAVDAAVADTTSIAGQIDQQLEDLHAYLAPLVATWTGRASSEYQVLQQRWDTSAVALNDVLRDIAGALATARSNYAAAEDANAALWHG